MGPDGRGQGPGLSDSQVRMENVRTIGHGRGLAAWLSFIGGVHREASMLALLAGPPLLGLSPF